MMLLIKTVRTYTDGRVEESYPERDIRKMDERGNLIYAKHPSTGYEEWMTYNDNNNLIYHKQIDSYGGNDIHIKETFTTYNEYGKVTYAKVIYNGEIDVYVITYDDQQRLVERRKNGKTKEYHIIATDSDRYIESYLYNEEFDIHETTYWNHDSSFTTITTTDVGRITVEYDTNEDCTSELYQFNDGSSKMTTYKYDNRNRIGSTVTEIDTEGNETIQVFGLFNRILSTTTNEYNEIYHYG